MSTDYFVPVCEKHGLRESVFTHMVPAAKGYFESRKFAVQCSREGCAEEASQFIRWEAGL